MKKLSFNRFMTGIMLCMILLAPAALQAQEKIPVTTSSEEAREQFIKGRDLYENFKSPESIPCFKKAVKLDPSFALAHLYLSAEATGGEDADKHFKKALESAQKKTEHGKVQAALRKFFHSIEQYDYDAIRDACADDFVIFENGVRMSCEDFVGLIQNYENMGATEMNYQLDHFTIEVKGRNAWVTLDNYGSGRLGEQTLELNWLESAILQKEKEQWKIAFYHSTEKPKPTPDLEKEQVAIAKCLDNLSRAYKLKDSELLSKVVAPGKGLCIFGTDEEEKWTDHDAFVQSQQRWFDNVEKSRFIVKERSIHPDPTGTYARFYQIVDFEGVAEGEPYKVENTRMSGILEKQNGRWVMVQWHGSVPVSGQLIEY